MKNFSFLVVIILFFAACSPEEKVDFKPLDLLKQGIPLTIMAPDSADVKKSDFGPVMKDITIRKGADYFVQIYASQASTSDVSKLKAQELAEVKNKKYFSKIVKDEPMGFIYETKVDSNYIDYGFRYVLIQGSNEYIFQTGLIGPFTLEAVEHMYEAVQQK